MLRNRVLLLFCVLTGVLYGMAEERGNTCPMIRIVPERLSDMTIPRSGHNTFYVNGELTVVGGHTTSFLPTITAEFLSDGKWHAMNMSYPHDNGFAVVLSSTPNRQVPQHPTIILGGGHAEELGVGQTYTLERYNPETHTFEGFGCLDKRRVLTSAMQLGDGRVIISGNHYADDAIACYDGRSQVQHLKDVMHGHCNPYILPLGNDDVLIFGPRDNRDNMLDTLWAYRLKGDAFRVPLQEQWKLLPIDQPFNSETCATGDGAYLLTAINNDRQIAIVMVRDTCFSLLPTTCPIPMKSKFGPLGYWGPVTVDRQRQCAYLLGADSLFHRQYVLEIDLKNKPAALTLYYTDSLEHATITIPIVTPEGDLILAGGIPNDNYKPLASVWLYHFTTDQQEGASHLPAWLWIVVTLAVVAVLAYLIYYKRKHRQMSSQQPEAPAVRLPDPELMKRICQFIEQDLRYLTPVKSSDIAMELGISVADMTDCINRQRHITFTQLVAEYRVRHAQQLLMEQPDMKLSELIASSGFTSESTFFRVFKDITGLSPREWLAQKNV